MGKTSERNSALIQSGISLHYQKERVDRDKYIRENIGVGEIIDSFTMDRGHTGGPEIHSVTNTGIIVVCNATTGKLITTLIARPEQLKRLYETIGGKPPRKLLRLAYKHSIDQSNYK